MNKFIGLALLVGLIAIVSCGKGQESGSDLLSPMDPHVASGNGCGPWFEGWYTRITSSNGQDVVAVITASYVPKGGRFSSENLPGYIALLRRDGETGNLVVREAFPDKTTMTVHGHRVVADPGDRTAADFRWQADGYGFVTEDAIDIRVDDASVAATFGSPRHWDARRPWRGPEGAAANLGILKSHWFVYSLASPANYTFTDGDRSFTGQGYAHQEKNWGDVFPSAYAWAQGSKPNGRSVFALAGGTLPTNNSGGEGWLLGIRTQNVSWDFRPQVPGTIMKTSMNACQGWFRLEARQPLKSAIVEINAQPSSFAVMAVPTADGFEPGTEQSFSAVARVRTFRHGPLTGAIGWGRQVDDVLISNSALEFGGQYMCNH